MVTGPLADVHAGLREDHRLMQTSYGVVWQEESRQPATGRLELTGQALRLESLADSEPTTREIAYDSLTGVRIGRKSGDRLGGRPTLVLERRSGQPIRIASVAQSSVVAEIAERLAAYRLGPEADRRLAVVVPLKDGSRDAVRALLQAGPPFDPAETHVDRHQVFLTRDEVVFVFESRLGAQAFEPLLTEPELWKIAASWREHVAGPPRVAEDVYAWAREGRDISEP